MPEDLVCKFSRCISVGSWRDPWRINGPARMKGRGRPKGGSGGGSALSVSSPSPLCISARPNSLGVHLSFLFLYPERGSSMLPVARVLRPSIRSVRPRTAK